MKQLEGVDFTKGEQGIKVYESIISSMKKKERKKPQLVSNSSSRKKRIANGSGTTIQEINKLLKTFEMMKKTMKGFKSGMGFGKNMFGKFPFLK